MPKIRNIINLISSTIIVCSCSLIIDQFEHFSTIPPDTWGVYYAIVGVTFAMISGLVLVQSLERYTNLKLLFQEELNALQDIRDYLIFLDDVPMEMIDKIKLSLSHYVGSVIEKDLPNMKNKCIEYSDTSPEMYEVIRDVDDIDINNKNRSQSVAMQGILSLIFEITTHRTKRFFVAKEDTHRTVFRLIVLMAIVIVLGLIMMDVGNIILHVFMVGTTHISLTLLIMILADLSNPFKGNWKVDLHGFELFQKTLVPDFKGGINAVMEPVKEEKDVKPVTEAEANDESEEYDDE